MRTAVSGGFAVVASADDEQGFPDVVLLTVGQSSAASRLSSSTVQECGNASVEAYVCGRISLSWPSLYYLLTG
eukprot:755644-Hanusia_phi.AAC.1